MKLPDLHEALLDAPSIEALFEDIAQHARIVEITVRGSSQRRAQAMPPSLDDARAQLGSPECRGVQLRYDFEGKEWWDTLIPQSDGVRLVRIAHTWDAGEGEPCA